MHVTIEGASRLTCVLSCGKQMSNTRPHQHRQLIHNIHDRCIDFDPNPHDEWDAMVEEELLLEHHKQLGDSIVEDRE